MGEAPHGDYGGLPQSAPRGYANTALYRKSAAYGDPVYNGEKLPVIQVGLGFNTVTPVENFTNNPEFTC